MKPAQQWFSEYAESHQNSTNEYIHWVCVPAIFFSILGLLAQWTFPFLPFSFSIFNSAMSFVALAGLLFYATMGLRVFLQMAIYLSINLWLIYYLDTSMEGTGYVYLAIFVLAWIGQFVGHKIEGKKPSFLKDLQFLMVGPAWVIHQWFERK